ncbi:MAG: PKD domain-containing protein, partial [Solirubrobacteraceae bacterium]
MLAALVAGLLLMPAASPATPGVASFGASQNGARTIAFTGNTVGATSWSWDFGDGSPADTAQNPTHAYAAPGDYTVTLTASDGIAPDITATTPVHVYDAPTANFTFAGGPTVNFTDTSVGTPISWSWDFGDSSKNSSSAQSPSHTYSAPGTYTVKLTVSNPAGSSTISNDVTIGPGNRAPVAQFTITTTPTSVGSLVQFDASTSTDPDGNPLTYAWDLDGNGTYPDATGVTASRSFPAAGTYTVGLRVSDGSLTDKQFHTV